MRKYIIFWYVFLNVVQLNAQQSMHDTTKNTIDFVSDTQQPMGIEKIYLRPTQNTRATAMIFDAILHDRPAALFMLGDIVALGYKNRKWVKVDQFLDSTKKYGINTYAILGNHDVMLRDRRGEMNFLKRFPTHIRTGYVQVIDSLAILLLNSNFSKLSPEAIAKQHQWYLQELDSLNNNPAIKGIIVTCHHPVFTNSNMVKPSEEVRLQFLPGFIATSKCKLFITGHAHAFEHFKYQNKDFLVIGGGGGLHQPLTTKSGMPADVASAYKPLFHYLQLKRFGEVIQLTSFRLVGDFSGFTAGYNFVINLITPH